jgi:hypothetical protein
MLYLWWRMEEERRRRVWLLYGWFSGLMLCGSLFGAVAWAARMMILVNYYKGDNLESGRDYLQYYDSLSISYSLYPIFIVPYAIEFLCLSSAKLMVLDRMTDFAAGQDEGTRKRWAARGRIVMAVVVLGNAVGLAANVAAVVHYRKAADSASEAHAYLASNNTVDSQKSEGKIFEEAELAGNIQSVQLFCEAGVLLLIVVAFVVTAVFCSRLFTARLRAVDAASVSAATGRALKLQMLGTTAFVFVSFVLRSVLSTMVAVTVELRNIDQCPGVTSQCDVNCYNLYTHMNAWMRYTPEFQLTIVLVSSPVALLVALWGMTSKQTLRTMKSGEKNGAMTLQFLLRTRSHRTI